MNEAQALVFSNALSHSKKKKKSKNAESPGENQKKKVFLDNMRVSLAADPNKEAPKEEKPLKVC